MSRKQFRWKTSPSARIGIPLARRYAAVPPALMALAKSHAARGEGMMKSGAPWNDQTSFARNSLYGRAEMFDIHLGTANTEYGPFLELGTVNMAPLPIIEPTVNEIAEPYFRDAVMIVRKMLSG